MQNNWKSLLKPGVVEKEDVSANCARFIAKPLERGFGLTLGNALRRVLIGSLQGAAVVGLKIDGVEHEFKSLPDVSEDIVGIAVNCRWPTNSVRRCWKQRHGWCSGAWHSAALLPMAIEWNKSYE